MERSVLLHAGAEADAATPDGRRGRAVVRSVAGDASLTLDLSGLEVDAGDLLTLRIRSDAHTLFAQGLVAREDAGTAIVDVLDSLELPTERAFERTAVDLPVALRRAAQHGSGRLLDVSPSGVRLTCDLALVAGEQVLVGLSTAPGEPPLLLDVVLVRADTTGAACDAAGAIQGLAASEWSRLERAVAASASD